MGESLDRAYLTIEDFLNSRHIRSDDIDHERSTDTLQFHFNKPGFDLAIILTAKSLIPTISSFQAPFQSKHGLTTHVIYLPDASRLKFCIRDLKLHEILYAIVVNEDSKKNDEYDLFILSDIIEFQKGMSYEGAVNLITDDFVNYMQEMKKMHHVPDRYPHAKNQGVKGFIEPSDNIRYLLCLLFDHRMLEIEELYELRNFVRMRKEAIVRTAQRSIDYAMTERPLPTYPEDRLKYYVYEHKQDLKSRKEQHNSTEDRIMPTMANATQHRVNDSQPQKYGSDLRELDVRSMQPPVGQPRTAVVPLAVPNSLSQSLPVSSAASNFSKSAIISASPKLYTNQPSEKVLGPQLAKSNPPPTKSSFLAPLAQTSAAVAPPVVKKVVAPTADSKSVAAATVKKVPTTPAAVVRPPIKPLFTPPMPGTAIVAAVPGTGIRPPTPLINRAVPPPNFINASTTNAATLAQRKIKFAITPAAKPAPPTHSNVVHKPPTGTVDGANSAAAATAAATAAADSTSVRSSSTTRPGQSANQQAPPLERSRSVNSSHSDPMSDFEKEDYNEYQLSPVSSESSEKMHHNQANIQNDKIEIDLTDEVLGDATKTGLMQPPAKKLKYSPDPKKTSKQDNPSVYVLNLQEDNPSLQPKVFRIGCNGFMNFFKFVLNLAPLSLPEHDVVIILMKKCLLDMERYINAGGLICPQIDIRACRKGGCIEILRIIENLCEEGIPSKHNVTDLNFMWTYFPKNISDYSITIMFYKLMKMLELSKLVQASNAILVNLLQRIERVAYCNFQLSDQKTSSFNLLNFFPSLFSEYFELKDDVAKLPLPIADIPTVTFNPDLDMIIMENKIKFVVGPTLEFFIETINSIHYELSVETLGVIYKAIRAARFCFRKISSRLVVGQLKKQIEFTESQNPTDITNELLDEINHIVREAGTLNCILFTRKHYELVTVLLDFSIEVKKLVEAGSDPDLDMEERENLVKVDSGKFVQDFSATIKTAVLGYHPDSEIDMFKSALKNRWLDTLHQAFKGTDPMPDGGRIATEMRYLLPKSWGLSTFNEAVTEAAMLSYSDWDKMLSNDFGRARVKYCDVRNNYLMWLANHGLEHRKAMEAMTGYQKTLDAKILEMSS